MFLQNLTKSTTPRSPPETRNKIMEFVLVPGEIHSPYSRTGVQLLATSRQNYEEGHVMYYSDNIFHIPRGRCYLQLLVAYSKKHLKLIRHVNFTCTILDIFEELFLNPTKVRTHEIQETELRRAIRILPGRWIFKKLYIQRTFPNLEDLRADFPDCNLLRARQKLGSHHALGIEMRTTLDKMYQRGSCGIVLQRHELGRHCDHWGKVECFPDISLPVSRLNGPLAVFCFLVSCSFYDIREMVEGRWSGRDGAEGLGIWLADKVEEEGRKYSW